MVTCKLTSAQRLLAVIEDRDSSGRLGTKVPEFPQRFILVAAPSGDHRVDFGLTDWKGRKKWFRTLNISMVNGNFSDIIQPEWHDGQEKVVWPIIAFK